MKFKKVHSELRVLKPQVQNVQFTLPEILNEGTEA